MLKTISRASLDFCSGVACGFIFEATSCAPFAFKVDVNLRIGLVCAYNSTMDFYFNGGVEESLIVCWGLELMALLLFEAVMVIMFLVVAIESFVENSFLKGRDER